ncbi:hypothetical protein [Flagellimonas marinaquae]|nr:hypothetical protein [Allomuricauda aquimarina]
MRKTLIENQVKWLRELKEENLSLKLQIELTKIEIKMATRDSDYD